MIDLQFDGWLNTFWNFNLDLSVIVLTVLLVRFFIRKTTKSYNSYLLWLAIPVGFVLAKVIASLDFSSVDSSYIGEAVSAMIIKPVETLQNYWWLGALWLTGTTLLLLRLIIQHIELRKDLKKIERPLSELAGAELFEARRYQVVAVDSKEMSPAVYGFIKPKIYFPIHVAKQLSVQQMQLIIEHEEQHIKQKHLWLNLLWDILVCIGWFNPLIYIARKNFRHDQELFCDYLVLNKTSQSRTKDYGHALLSTVSATHSVSLLCSWKVFNQLEERIMNITKPINRKGKAALTLGAGLVLSCCAVYAANKEVHDKTVIKNEEVMLELVDEDGVTYIQENDKYYIEKNGERREMTATERAAFERKHEATMKEVELSEQELIMIEKEIESAQKELEFHTEEIELAHKEMEHAHEAIAEAEREIELEFKEGALSEEQLKHARKSLEQARKQFDGNKMNIKVDIEKAKEGLEKAKVEIRKMRLNKKYGTAVSDDRRILTIDENLVKNSEGHSSHVIKLVDNGGKVYLKTDGDYRIKENGKEREMSSDEKAYFDEKVKAIPQPPKPPKPVLPAKPSKSPKAPSLSILDQPAAVYPKAALEQGIEGYVDLTFDINDQGKATNIRVVESSDNGLFNKDAIEAVKKWKFDEKDYGKTNMKYKMKFALDSEDISG
ncbi:hypothetical protein GCM10009123_07960 [Kangiella japonica]|uniref:TonB C-terminal domain-containing protein n=1 Tax=Kangiella japonica TaxID=647384 RepID=A0ABN0SW29_9GAMM